MWPTVLLLMPMMMLCMHAHRACSWLVAGHYYNRIKVTALGCILWGVMTTAFGLCNSVPQGIAFWGINGIGGLPDPARCPVGCVELHTSPRICVGRAGAGHPQRAEPGGRLLQLLLTWQRLWSTLPDGRCWWHAWFPVRHQPRLASLAWHCQPHGLCSCCDICAEPCSC